VKLTRRHCTRRSRASSSQKMDEWLRIAPPGANHRLPHYCSLRLPSPNLFPDLHFQHIKSLLDKAWKRSTSGSRPRPRRTRSSTSTPPARRTMDHGVPFSVFLAICRDVTRPPIGSTPGPTAARDGPRAGRSYGRPGAHCRADPGRQGPLTAIANVRVSPHGPMLGTHGWCWSGGAQ
jgi:hypothetical protein